MEIVEAVLAMMAACIALAVLARFAGLPYAVVLILGGCVLAFIPGLPDITLNPELALAFFLPPLLQASAYRTDWQAFRRNIRPILMLALGCVAFTALLIGCSSPRCPGRRPSPSAPSWPRPMRWRPPPFCNDSTCQGASSPCWKARAW